ncbi:RluA family pseudouridine synthase [Acuticoccus sp. I52.16.1]|uniref:RluA family pseudouridine synthase n=1 Tax=Acuticoccus sp. I52.16.1 TaxID=2928472 RepID=UPI001FD2B163|nr:RluA family pseudouridine synthase [Acuticoccus sp. I52.16.1]UOM36947.1 RluA family pseudouridine synthase [Acuticoccus sp. I52.16.1]
MTRAGRADALLAAASGLSRTRVQALIRSGATKLNGEPLSDPAARLTVDDAVTLVVPPPEPAEPAAEAIPLDVLYEDDAVLVLDKPAGMVVHPAAGHASGTLVNALLAHCAGSLSGIGGVLRPGIVHRLDKDTSGVMVVAKSDAAHQSLAAQFADHGRTGPLRRRYHAFAWGAPEPQKGVIDKPLGRHPTDRQRFAVRADGRQAITHYRLVRRVGPVSEIALELETGRTHQIRVHLTAIGTPLVGDPVYGTGFATKANLLPPAAKDAAKTLGRQALHAAHLTFEHPITGEVMAFDAPLPADLAAFAAALDAG